MIALSLTPVISVYVPRFLAFWPLILGLGTAYWLLVVKKEIFALSRLYYGCAIAISALCILSAAWSIAPLNSFMDALKITSLLMLGGVCVSSFKALDIESLKPYFWILPVGLLVACGLCLFDLCYDLYLYKLLHHDSTMNSSGLNRGITCCVFFSFLFLPFIRNLYWEKLHKATFIGGVFLTLVLMLSLSQTQAGQLSFILGSFFYFAFPSRWRLSYLILGFALLLIMLTTPLIIDSMYAFVLNSGQGDGISWLREAYIGDRVEIWHFVMNYAMDNPLYGFGVEATHSVPFFKSDNLYSDKTTALHPHNFSVQLWIEFGLIGVVTATGVFAVLLRSLFYIENKTVRKSLTTVFIMTLLVAAITYGLWQSWWIGLFVLMIGMGALMSNIKVSNE